MTQFFKPLKSFQFFLYQNGSKIHHCDDRSWRNEMNDIDTEPGIKERNIFLGGEGDIKDNKFLKRFVRSHQGVISSIGLIRVLKRATYGKTCSLSSTNRLTRTSIHYNIWYPPLWCHWCQQYYYINSYISEALQALPAYLYTCFMWTKNLAANQTNNLL